MLTFRVIFQAFEIPSKSIFTSLTGFSTVAQKNSIAFKDSLKFSKTRGLSLNSTISDHLRNQRLDEARQIFNEIKNPDVYLYTNMINGYSRNNRLNEALQLFDKMPNRDAIAWNSTMKGCLDCGDLAMARKLFDEMPERNVVSWTTMISGYLRFGKIEVADDLFGEMPLRDITAWNSMISGYFSNGRVSEASKLFEEMPFRNVISWTSMISGLDQNGRSGEALALFRQMIGSGLEPTSNTFSCVITACANAFALDQGLQIHACVLKYGYFIDDFISASVITFYANCKKVEDFCKVFSEKMHDNVVVWTSLLTGFNLNSKHEDALKLFGDMMKRGILPNQSSFTSALNSCCELEAIDRGKVIHAMAIKLRFQTDAFVSNSLVVLYSKCGSIKDGVAAFKGISLKNLVSWNSMIVGCAQHGLVMWVLSSFAQMIRANEVPDEITFTGLLYASSHSGMLHKGRHFFHYFTRYTSMEMKLEHYASMVDIMGRHGELEEAEEFIKTSPINANSVVWLALLSACRMHSNLEIAERAAKCILVVEPHCIPAYILLSNLYASANRWTDVSRIRWEMKKIGVVKQEGCSWVTVKGERHENNISKAGLDSCEAEGIWLFS
ncbi:hypothetical protein Nepgr_028682 [Nepenthes gracilis]|uniref:Pentatricopeptide repeat-containing protein n=1 Tax=Nepenthes gracilis TaxID=150966 RepID=A0AAD3TDB9_NEPGR|nr:hypothetical protein Nepgr_028682 [Nepenthes gracilis]